MLIKITEAAKLLGVSEDYLRHTKVEGLDELKTTGGHRRYNKNQVLALIGEKEVKRENSEKVIVYSRVSSTSQKLTGDLDRQKLRNLEYCIQKGYEVYKTFEEVGSGMSDERVKLQGILKLAYENKFGKLVVEHSDRLTRFNYKMYEYFLRLHGVEIEVIHETLGKTLETEMVEDIMSLVQSAASKVSGRRSAENRKRNKEMGIKSKYIKN